MARKINENVVDINTAPKKRQSAKAKAAAEAARLAADESRGLKGPAVDDDRDPDDERTAPGFGHNAPDVGVYLRHVQAIRRQQEKVEAAKLVVKAERGKLKDVRKLAQADGLVMKQLDEALEDLAVEHVDLIAQHKRRMLYHEWLGLNLNEQPELDLHAREGDTELDAKRWWKRGDLDGRLGRVREVPAGCPPEHLQDYLKGHDNGQEVLMRGLPLTKAGFDADGKVTDTPAEKPAADVDDPKGGILVMHEGYFVAGTDLENANLRTLLGEHHEAFMAADRVVALFGTRRRILREPDADADDGFYVDTGDDDVPVTDPEYVGPEAADLA